MKDTHKDLWQNLPNKTGVYLFKDGQGAVLYIGKALDLKKRVSSYFLGKHQDRPWTAVLVGLISEIETIVVTNEVEALMLEATLIKQHLPRFNIKLTDDKAYPYIKLVKDEPIPRLTVTRRRQRGDKAMYFGPYLSARSAIWALEFLRRLYGIHLSPKPLRGGQDRACLSCQLGGFSCPLADEVDEETYRQRVQQAVEFLQGKRKRLKDDLEQKMIEASQREQYELASTLRDRLKGVEQVLGKQQVIGSTTDDYDVVGAYKTGSQAAVATLRVREGRVTGQLTFFFEVVGDESEVDVVRTFLTGVYLNFADIPAMVTISSQPEDLKLIEELLGTAAWHKVTLRSAVRGEKRALVELAVKNARSKLEMKLLKTDQSYGALIALQELLGLPKLPERIEAVDISNLGTSEPVGATVCFINGQPDKNEYRRYKIKTVEGQNDFAMIQEVTARRFSDTSRPLPDLFVIDGGPEQLRAALKALTSLAPNLHELPLVALAKKPDRVFVPGRKMPLAATRGHKGVMLLARIRDEVHRYVIGFHRARQSRKSLSSHE
jgi:excinuclease ABC subunit C